MTCGQNFCLVNANSKAVARVMHFSAFYCLISVYTVIKNTLFASNQVCAIEGELHEVL